MKRKSMIYVALAVVFTGMILTTGCGKKETTPDNNFVYNDTTYTLSQGLISTISVSDSFYVHYIYMLSDGFNVMWNGDKPQVIDSIKGRGEALLFGLISKSADDPEDGVYNAMVEPVKSAVVPEPFTWMFGLSLINYSEIGDNHVGQRLKLTTGTVKVKNNGNNELELTIDVSSEKNLKLTGFFKGTFKRFVIEGKKSLDLDPDFLY